MGIGSENSVTISASRYSATIIWKPILALIVVLVLIFGRNVYGSATASSRITPEVAAAAPTQRYLDLLVVLDFKPEDFHIKYFQSVGVMSGVVGTTVKLRRVEAGMLPDIASNYWIQRIELLKN